MGPHPPLRSTRLLDQLCERIRYDHCSLKTEQSYVQRVRRFVHFRALRHLKDLGRPGVEALLAELANARQHARAPWVRARAVWAEDRAAGLASPLDSPHCAEPHCPVLH